MRAFSQAFDAALGRSSEGQSSLIRGTGLIVKLSYPSLKPSAALLWFLITLNISFEFSLYFEKGPNSFAISADVAYEIPVIIAEIDEHIALPSSLS